MKYDYNLLLDFCKENNVILRNDYSNKKVTSGTIIEGKCFVCDESFMKKFSQIYISKSYYCKTHLLEIRKQKSKSSCLEKYGVENISQSKTTKEKKKNTTLQNWGVANPSQSKIITPLKI